MCDKALVPGNQDMLVYQDGTVGTGLCPHPGQRGEDTGHPQA